MVKYSPDAAKASKLTTGSPFQCAVAYDAAYKNVREYDVYGILSGYTDITDDPQTRVAVTQYQNVYGWRKDYNFSVGPYERGAGITFDFFVMPNMSFSQVGVGTILGHFDEQGYHTVINVTQVFPQTYRVLAHVKLYDPNGGLIMDEDNFMFILRDLPPDMEVRSIVEWIGYENATTVRISTFYFDQQTVRPLNQDMSNIQDVMGDLNNGIAALGETPFQGFTTNQPQLDGHTNWLLVYGRYYDANGVPIIIPSMFGDLNRQAAGLSFHNSHVMLDNESNYQQLYGGLGYTTKVAYRDPAREGSVVEIFGVKNGYYYFDNALVIKTPAFRAGDPRRMTKLCSVQ